MRTYLIRLVIFLNVLVVFSCSKWDDYKKYTREGETVYTGKMDSVKVYSGYLRVRVTGLLPADPKIVRCVISWTGTSGKDSVVFAVSKTGIYETFDTTFSVQEEGTKNFIVQTFDKKGNASLPVDAVGTVYGPDFESELPNRPLIDAFIASDGSGLVTDWDLMDASRGPLGTEIRFVNSHSDTVSSFLPLSQDKITLDDYKPGTDVTYNTLYLPDSTAIDTLSCPVDSLKIEPVKVVVDSITGGKTRLGVNYNGQFEFIDFNKLARTETKWVRGFIDFFRFYEHPEQLQSDQGVNNFLQLKAHGYKTILNIKWNFSNKAFPDTSGNEMKNYETFLTELLDRFWGKMDIIVIGNEPFIESRTNNRGPALVRFYERVAHDVERYEDSKGAAGNVPIFIGAFNNLYLESWQSNSVDQLLSFAESDSRIAGIDLHIHHDDISQLKTALDYVNNKIRYDQRILVTEFSLVKYFQSKLNLSIPQRFADNYSYSEQMKVYQYIDRALKNQVSKKEWDDFLSGCNWFETRKKYLLNAFNIFKGYPKMAVATYGVRQSYPPGQDFTADKMPWILNSIYANRTTKPGADGLTPFNYAWIDDFLSVQHQ